MSPIQPNPFLLAADNSPDLIPFLRANPNVASSQDEHGYSLVHAAASYNHLDLLRTLITDLGVDPNLVDEDGETALFVAETIECARALVEEFNADINVRGDEAKTAREKIEAEGDFPDVAAYLLTLEDGHHHISAYAATDPASIIGQAPPLPDGLSIDVGTMSPEEAGEEVVNTEFKRRIEALAARGDFQGEEGQQQLRELITEALRGHVADERDVRQRTG